MRAFVAVTNPEWYRFLSDPTRSEIPVVNFWKPGGGSFRALNDGEYFVFKAKAPVNRRATVAARDEPEPVSTRRPVQHDRAVRRCRDPSS
jgi:hypothetical protein